MYSSKVKQFFAVLFKMYVMAKYVRCGICFSNCVALYEWESKQGHALLRS